MENTIDYQDYQPSPFEDAERVGIPCPVCKADLYLITSGAGPDNYTNELVCSNCGYSENE